MMKVYDVNNQEYLLDKQIASQGEGKLFTVRNFPELIAKIYHEPNREREEKVSMMIEMKPSQPEYPIVAWPLKTLYQKGFIWKHDFVGFLMPLVDRTVTLYTLLNKERRKKLSSQLGKLQLYRVAFNLAQAVTFIHQMGHVIGDINEGNFVVNARSLVTIVDADSIQITVGSIKTFRSPVGKDEYTPPELTGVSFKDVDRTELHDRFGLAVLIFQLLMNGSYPYRGKLKQDRDIERLGQYCKQQGIFPYVENPLVEPPPNAPPFKHLPIAIQRAFKRCFVDGFKAPESRPTANEWTRILHISSINLKTCPHYPDHLYGPHLETCPWCS